MWRAYIKVIGERSGNTVYVLDCFVFAVGIVGTGTVQIVMLRKKAPDPR